MRAFSRPTTAVVLCLALWPAAVHAWGFDGHRKLASMMQDPLPTNSCLKGWLQSKQTAALQDSACNPDRWRYTTSPQYDPAEWPRHYLEVDRVSPASAYPRDWPQVVTDFGRYAEQNGRVPWRVEELYVQLVTAFRARDTATIVQLAFVFSHYVTDAFSLLHDTLNFDPNGLHSRWESDMLGVSANLSALATAAPTFYGTAGRVPDVRYAIFDIVIVGNAQLPTLIAADQAHADLPGFFTAVKELTARRFGDALTLLASLLWTAWADAGAPALPGFAAGCSMALPTQTVAMQGFAVPGGFTDPDAGYQAPDASFVDAGYDDGGLPDGLRPDAGDGVVDPGAAPACGCGATGLLPPAMLFAALLLVRRRAPRSATAVAGAVLWCALLCLGGCRDAGAEALTTAKARYTALTSAATSLDDRAYDELLGQLKAVPGSSKAHAEAIALATAIEHARASRVAAPLANARVDVPPTVPGLEALRAELVIAQQECAALAGSLGALKPQARAAKYELLGACQRRAHALDEALGHAEQNMLELQPMDGGAR